MSNNFKSLCKALISSPLQVNTNPLHAPLCKCFTLIWRMNLPLLNMYITCSSCEVLDLKSLQFDFGTIIIATNNFSEANKLEKGGFGVVYKVWECYYMNWTINHMS